MPVASATVSNADPYLLLLSRSMNRGFSPLGVASLSWLCDPELARTPRHTEVNHTPGLQLDDEEHITLSKQHVDHGYEIASPNACCMSLQERCPVLTGWALWPFLSHVALDCPLGHPNPELQQLSPIRSAPHSRFSRTILRISSIVSSRFLPPSPPCPALELPEQLESLAVPAQEGVWLDDQQRLAPCLHDLGVEQQAQPICRCQARTLGLSLEDRQLLAQQRVLGDHVCFAARIDRPQRPARPTWRLAGAGARRSH